ncbi:hypothetical protein AVEN_260361-1, partial [Araneus ventricosus]
YVNRDKDMMTSKLLRIDDILPGAHLSDDEEVIPPF